MAKHRFFYAMVLTCNHAEAEDLVQETYMRAMRSMWKLRADSNIKGWLFTILKNIWFNQLRKHRNGPQMVEIEAGDGVANNIVEPSKDSHDLYVSKLEAEQVRAAIQELPVEFREIILLREYEDLSYREIASIMHCPLGTVMSRLGEHAQGFAHCSQPSNVEGIRFALIADTAKAMRIHSVEAWKKKSSGSQE